MCSQICKENLLACPRGGKMGIPLMLGRDLLSLAKSHASGGGIPSVLREPTRDSPTSDAKVWSVGTGF